MFGQLAATLWSSCRGQQRPRCGRPRAGSIRAPEGRCRPGYSDTGSVRHARYIRCSPSVVPARRWYTRAAASTALRRRRPSISESPETGAGRDGPGSMAAPARNPPRSRPLLRPVSPARQAHPPTVRRASGVKSSTAGTPPSRPGRKAHTPAASSSRAPAASRSSGTSPGTCSRSARTAISTLPGPVRGRAGGADSVRDRSGRRLRRRVSGRPSGWRRSSAFRTAPFGSRPSSARTWLGCCKPPSGCTS